MRRGPAGRARAPGPRAAPEPGLGDRARSRPSRAAPGWSETGRGRRERARCAGGPFPEHTAWGGLGGRAILRGMAERGNALGRGSRGRSLLDKVWDAHSVRELPSGQTQLFIGLHLIHEVTSPQAFAMLRDAKLRVRFPARTFATVDHIIPTESQQRPLADDLAEELMVALEPRC